MTELFRSLADIEAMEAIHLEDRDLPASTYDVILRTAQAAPDAPALAFIATPEAYDRPEIISYRQLLEGITRAANVFQGLGVRPGQAVSFLLPLLPQTHYVLWGAQAAGIANPVNPLIEPQQIAEIIEAAGAEIIVTLAPEMDGGELWRKTVQAVARLFRVRTIFLVGCSHGVADLEPGMPGRITVLDFGHAMAEADPARLISRRVIHPNEIATYFHTGGTTGTPKLAQHTHGNEVCSGWQFSHLLDLPVRASVLCGLPMFHVNAAIITGMAPFSRGQCVVMACPSGFRTPGLLDRFWKIVEHYKIAAFSAVPTLLISLLERPVDADLEALRYVVCGAAPLPVEVLKRFEAVANVRILEGYGLTEGTCGSTMNPRDGERRSGSIGLRFPYQSMRTVEIDGDGRYLRDCSVDEVGLIVLSGPNVFPGYRQEQHNSGAWVEIDGVRWLNTGDMGRLDREGYFWLTGRKKELIIRGGHNIDPKIIENALHEHPAVQVAAAVGRPDAYAGELPVAYVSLKPGCTISEAELLGFAAQAISERAAVPKSIHILPALPVTAVGKLFKPVLREREAADACRTALAALPDVIIATVGARTDAKLGLVVSVELVVPASQQTEVGAKVRTALGRFAWSQEISMIQPD